jgi:hypothetical protein
MSTTRKDDSGQHPTRDRERASRCAFLPNVMSPEMSVNVQSCRRGSLQRAVFVEVSEANEAGNCLLTAVATGAFRPPGPGIGERT